MCDMYVLDSANFIKLAYKQKVEKSHNGVSYNRQYSLTFTSIIAYKRLIT